MAHNPVKSLMQTYMPHIKTYRMLCAIQHMQQCTTV